MTDLNKLSPAALKAAIQGGTVAWGKIGSASENVRYAEIITPKSRQKCLCGCNGKRTHKGMANGVCLMTACHLRILRWVKMENESPYAATRRAIVCAASKEQPCSAC